MLLFFVSAFSQTNLPPLDNIQSKISTGFNKGYEGDTSALTGIIRELNNVKYSGVHYTTYWLAYATFKLATVYISKDKKISETKTDQAAALLEKLDNKISEDYVLLGTTLSFSLNFKGV